MPVVRPSNAAACLDVLVAKRRVTQDAMGEGKTLLLEIVAMLVGLIRSNSTTRTFEEPPSYGGDAVQ